MTGRSIAFEVMKRSEGQPGGPFLAFVLIDQPLNQLLNRCHRQRLVLMEVDSFLDVREDSPVVEAPRFDFSGTSQCRINMGLRDRTGVLKTFPKLQQLW
jgi:hypothetical protein